MDKAPSPPRRFFESLRRRFPAQSTWVAARFSPEGHLGLHLTIGFLTLVLMAWIFGNIAEDVVTQDQIVLFDQQLVDWFNQHGTPAFFQIMTVISWLGAGEWQTAVTVVAGAILLWRRAWYRLILLLLVVPLGGLLDSLLKLAFQRPRPVVARPLVTLDTYSFPSGHTMGATLVYGLAAVLACYLVRSWSGRFWIVFAASCVISLVALSRIALGAHFLTDVLAAIVAGLAWLAVCVTSVETLRRHRLMRKAAARSTETAS
jgi:undecaprenyl-diphosphatase